LLLKATSTPSPQGHDCFLGKKKGFKLLPRQLKLLPQGHDFP